MKAVLFASLSLLPLPAIAAAAPPAADHALVPYVVRRGDNLYTFAARYLKRTADFEAVRRLNHVGNPYALPIGSTLRVPRQLLRDERVQAHVEAFSGPVRISTGGRSGAPTENMPVGEASSIETGANAFVTLRLTDGSTISIPSQSRVTVSWMRKVVLTGAVERLFDIDTGRARAVVTPMTNRGSSFRLGTPIAIAAVRGTQFRVAYDPERHTGTTAVLKGVVGVNSTSNGKSGVDVPAGDGTVASAGGVGALVKLLPAPKLADPGRIQNEAELAFSITPVAGAASYHVVVARDADILDQVEETQSAATTVTLPSLPTGTYFVSISAVDGNGLEGEPEIYAFERRLNSIAGSMESDGSGRDRHYRFRWYSQGDGARQFRFQLSTHEDGSAPIIDEIGLSDTHLAVTNLPTGDYYWRVLSVQFADGKAVGAWMPLHHFHVETH